MIDPGSIIIIILCIVLLIISIPLEIIKIKIMRKKSEQIKREILIFCTLLGIAIIVLIIFVKISQLGILESVMIGDNYGHGTANVGGAIESIMQFITLIIITVIAIKPLIYIIKQRKDCKNNNQKEEKNGK